MKTLKHSLTALALGSCFLLSTGILHADDGFDLMPTNVKIKDSCSTVRAPACRGQTQCTRKQYNDGRLVYEGTGVCQRFQVENLPIFVCECDALMSQVGVGDPE